jgi:cytochrome c oxidase subunit 4
VDRTFWQVCRAPLLAWATLLVLLATTCFLAYVPMGRANLVTSLSIAAAKAMLVALVFMRLAEGEAINRLAASAGPIWVFIMLLLTAADYFTR